MKSLKDVKLVLFFTRPVSLRTWDQIGMFEREVEVYRRLLPYVGGIAFLTYGDRSELQYGSRLDGIKILCNYWGLPQRVYALLAPLLHWRHLRQMDIFKTNQTEGSEVALLAKRIFGKKMIARAGFMWSLFFEEFSPHDFSVRGATSRERAAFTQSDLVVVTTSVMKEYAVKHYHLSTSKVRVIPNYVLTELFRPSREDQLSKCRVIYVGRLAEQKNLLALLQAIHGLNVELVLIGEGPQRQLLQEKALNYGLNVHFLGKQPHYKLPELLNQADIFVLPSYWEGHPKVLLEAMACGLPVIGTDVPGIQNLIEHRQTGFLCGQEPDEIRSAIRELLEDHHLRAHLGRRARDYIVENFSMDRILNLELNLLKSLITSGDKAN